jgi:hypothetical protein
MKSRALASAFGPGLNAAKARDCTSGLCRGQLDILPAFIDCFDRE